MRSNINKHTGESNQEINDEKTINLYGKKRSTENVKQKQEVPCWTSEKHMSVKQMAFI